MNINAPAEAVSGFITVGTKKAANKPARTFVLAIMAGIFIGFGAIASSTCALGAQSVGQGKFITGAVFPVGLMMILLIGAELFTGDCLAFMAFLDRKIKGSAYLKLLVIVYAGNLIGALFMALINNMSGQMDLGSCGLAASVTSIGINKCKLGFGAAICSGVLCNIIVCMAVMCANVGTSAVCKIFASYLPVLAFASSGFEHCIANMYYLFASKIALSIPRYAAAAAEAGLDTAALSIRNIFLSNLLAVTIGNVLGGFFIASCIWFGHAAKTGKRKAVKK